MLANQEPMASRICSGLIPPSSAKKLKPVGQWNSSRIVFRGNHGEHWLNGAKVVEFELGTPPLVSLPYSVQTNDVPAYFEMKVSVPEFEAMLKRLSEIFHQYQWRGCVRFEYLTEVHFAPLA